jgi:hypothetical protein
MIDDLRQLNRLIASHWLGHLDAEEGAYVDFASVCVGQLAHGATELTQLLSRLQQQGWNLLSVGELNRRYLAFARLAAKDATADSLDMLVRLGITLRQAAFLRTLSDEDLDRLAFGCAGPMMRFAAQAFRRGVRLHPQAGKHHAAALVAARHAENVLPQR